MCLKFLMKFAFKMDRNFALNGSITTFTRLEWYKAKEKRHSLLQSCPQRLLVVRTTSTLFATTYVLSAATVEKLLGVTNEVHKIKANSVWRVLPSSHSISTCKQADKGELARDKYHYKWVVSLRTEIRILYRVPYLRTSTRKHAAYQYCKSRKKKIWRDRLCDN